MKRNIVIAGIAAAALVAGGTATAVALTGGSGGSPAAGAAPSVTAPASGIALRSGSGSGSTGPVSVEQVIRAAQARTPGTVTSAELDHGRWEVDLYGKDGTWHELRLDPRSGKVTSSRTDDGDQDDRKGAPVTAARAAAAARGAVAGTVTSVELDNGRWEAEVTATGGARHEVYVDLDTGKVTAEHLHRHEHDGHEDDHQDRDDD
ncbi:PepSY domain-containing protein [Streptomyces sp. A 4/2]|uniref:PepSY domain-containing protein n=1 Tax=Streptomyces sp. A 4/2 TaxID=2934314 RepID=UPI002025155D|nr:PepSY domain-containing protein [Streptomyces sp. A 4/2]